MNILRGIIIFITLVVCCPAQAETPQQAYGVTVVGPPHCIGSGVGLRCSTLTGHPYILVGGYWSVGDGGGGYFSLGPSGCTDNGGTILHDLVGNCFYRQDSRAAAPVQWFGAKCDAITTVYGGTTSADGTQFTASGPTNVTFQTGDVGKVIEFNPVGQGSTPFQTEISAVNTSTNTVTLRTPIPGPSSYTGQAGATGADFKGIQEKGQDSPGAGYAPLEVLTITGGVGATPAEVQIVTTSLVNFDQVSGGSKFQLNDLVYISATDTTDYNTVRKAVIQVTGVDPNGVVTSYGWVNNGQFKQRNGGTTNPSTLTATGGHGSGFTLSTLPNNASFGVGNVIYTPYVAGLYSQLPPIPSQTSCLNCSGSGATVDMEFPTPTWTYGTDDTTALTALEAWMETDYDRGIYNAAEIAGDRSCLLQTLVINRPVTWRSSGSRQAQLEQILGAPGSTIDNTNYGFVLAAATFADSDTYQDTTIGQHALGFNNISIIGGARSQTVDVDGTITTVANAGLLFQNPTGKPHKNGNTVMENLQVANFPGNALSALYYSGELRGYNVYAGAAGGNCVDLEHTDNPYRFFGLVASACKIGLNLVDTKSEEFHGASFFGNGDKNVSVTGARGDPEAYILFDGAQFESANNENMYLDQQGETVICAANCYFSKANMGQNTGGDGDASVVIGPDATTSAGGSKTAPTVTPTVLVLDQGAFSFGSGDVAYDIQFDQSQAGTSCLCTVSLGPSMLDIGNGVPTTNNAALMLGQTGYAPPTFANAASIGVPLTLNPNELGIGVSPSSGETAPGGNGLKLRVECGTNPGTAKLVALAGNSSTVFALLDNIGSGVQNC